MDIAPDPDTFVAPFGRGGDRIDPRRMTLDHWGTALASGDADEIDRLVRQSRADRTWIAASGQLGTMLG